MDFFNYLWVHCSWYIDKHDWVDWINWKCGGYRSLKSTSNEEFHYYHSDWTCQVVFRSHEVIIHYYHWIITFNVLSNKLLELIFIYLFQLWYSGDNNEHIYVFVYGFSTHRNVYFYILLPAYLSKSSGICLSHCFMLSDWISISNTCRDLGAIYCRLLVIKSKASLYTGKYLIRK